MRELIRRDIRAARPHLRIKVRQGDPQEVQPSDIYYLTAPEKDRQREWSRTRIRQKTRVPIAERKRDRVGRNCTPVLNAKWQSIVVLGVRGHSGMAIRNSVRHWANKKGVRRMMFKDCYGKSAFKVGRVIILDCNGAMDSV